MSHRDDAQFEGFGSDSFLDIVANIVGILIILVIVAGLRAKSTAPAPDLPTVDVEPLRAQASSLEDELAELNGQIQEVAGQTLERFEERKLAGDLVATIRYKLDEAARELDAHQQERLALASRLARLQQQRQQVEAQFQSLAAPPEEIVTVTAYPTPISRTVHGEEAHFQVRNGHVAYVPIDELVSRLKDQARSEIGKLRDSSDVTSTVGPVRGFRMRYTWVRHDVALDYGGAITGTGSYAMLESFTMLPVSEELGEPVDVALGEAHSEFRADLARFDAQRTTITLWTYPDSFAEFRRLREELYRMGFATAARPLPHGVSISGSPNGSKSAAQ
jgi:hypothetical protein